MPDFGEACAITPALSSGSAVLTIDAKLPDRFFTIDSREMKLTATSSTDRSEIEPKAEAVEEVGRRLLGIIGAILERLQETGVGQQSRPDLDLDTDFADLGLNSVDFLEFILEVENQLDMDVPDGALIDQTLHSARTWARFMVARGAGPTGEQAD